MREKIDSVEASLQRLKSRVPEFPVEEILLVRLMLFLTHDFTAMLDHHTRPFGLGEGEFRVLTALFSQPDSTAHPGDLGARATQSPASMSRITDSLVERGLITRIASSEDRRKLVLRITDKGTALVQSALPTMFAPIRKVFSVHTGAERRQLIGALKKLAVSLEQNPSLPVSGDLR